MYEFLDKRYARALYEVADENGKVDEYIETLKLICELIDNYEEFYEFIKNPQVGTRNKKKAFINIFKNKIDEDLLSFLLILIEKDRILHLREKVNEMEKINLEKNNTLKGVVKTTIPLLDEQYKLLINNLENKYNKKIILERIIDPNIIGSIYVKVEDEVIDGTIKFKMDKLRELMLELE
ncbi:F0F1 ATP synthase subunit delta [Clostridium sp. NSJ-49]|uniref:F0F1 ATP synthase subunit delta n=1 Tax=Clostridium TaxID=1485 RepID=UPI00164BE4F0|nr:F0F1 ATP synthase subunit delta [Clostridium sp. NSJ-49]MBC5625650.1 F0F1 ATP synthase subunit delta [Clostridium sp. NSJ-49]